MILNFDDVPRLRRTCTTATKFNFVAGGKFYDPTNGTKFSGTTITTPDSE
jgi:hypothetical protein